MARSDETDTISADVDGAMSALTSAEGASHTWREYSDVDQRELVMTATAELTEYLLDLDGAPRELIVEGIATTFDAPTGEVSATIDELELHGELYTVGPDTYHVLADRYVGDG